MKRKSRNNFVSTDISFDDYMSHPESVTNTDRSVTELAEEAKTAELETKKRDRELKAAKQKEKRANRQVKR